MTHADSFPCHHPHFPVPDWNCLSAIPRPRFLAPQQGGFFFLVVCSNPTKSSQGLVSSLPPSSPRRRPLFPCLGVCPALPPATVRAASSQQAGARRRCLGSHIFLPGLLETRPGRKRSANPTSAFPGLSWAIPLIERSSPAVPRLPSSVLRRRSSPSPEP